MTHVIPGPIIVPYNGIWPTIADDAYIAPGATVAGNVTIGRKSSVWFGAVVRGDLMPVTIGDYTNIQDNSTVHITRGNGPTTIGSGVTIGHAVMLHACTIEDDAFIGMHATMLDHSTVKSGGMLAAGALLTPRKTVASGELWAGNPARLMREMRQDEKDFIPVSADNYVRLSREFMASQEK